MSPGKPTGHGYCRHPAQQTEMDPSVSFPERTALGSREMLQEEARGCSYQSETADRLDYA